MNFRTTIKNTTNYPKISYKSKVLLLGSCFSDSIGSKLKDYSFDVSINPFGVVFNPITLEKQLQRVAKNSLLTIDELVKHNDKYCHFDYHSSFNSSDGQEVLKKINDLISSQHEVLREIDHVFITLGTSFVYRHQATDTFVGNCHKIPQSNFTKILLSPTEIFHSLQSCTAILRAINPQINVVFTVSPVRHIKEGLVENSRSKANLIAGLHQLVDEGLVQYFPAFELFMDDLRDYRFYKSDLIHPNDQGVQYVWEFFKACFLRAKTLDLLDKVVKIKHGLNHKPSDQKDPLYLAHLRKMKELRHELLEEHPYILLK